MADKTKMGKFIAEVKRLARESGIKLIVLRYRRRRLLYGATNADFVWTWLRNSDAIATGNVICLKSRSKR